MSVPGPAGRIPGGPGWSIDSGTLRPVLEDEGAFRAANAEDPALDLLVALWSGRPGAAEPLARELVRRASTVRHRALLADVVRDLGRAEEAVTTYRELLDETRGTGREAVISQHLGKALLAAGRPAEAVAAFRRSLELRLDAGADPDLVASSRAALDRATAIAATEAG